MPEVPEAACGAVDASWFFPEVLSPFMLKLKWAFLLKKTFLDSKKLLLPLGAAR